MSLPHIAVIGSLNVDLVTTTSRVPSGGETIHAVSHSIGYGGKGANQACACARLTRSHDLSNALAHVSMVGVIGDDQFSFGILRSLEEAGCSVKHVRALKGQRTGTATILVEQKTGENRILVVAGANGTFGPDDELVPEDADVVLFQHEIPLQTVISNIRLAKSKGAQVILNPAPAVPLPTDIYGDVDHLILNSSEALLLIKSMPGDSVTKVEEPADPDSMHESMLNDIAGGFINAGTSHVIVTLGSRGCFYQTMPRYVSGRGGQLVPAHEVSHVVDTTGAGDAFVGAYAAKVAEGISSRKRELTEDAEGKILAKGISIDEAVRYAVKVSGKSVEAAGARGGVPWADQVEG